MHGVSVIGLELGAKVSLGEVGELLQDPLATFREAAPSCPRVVAYMFDCPFQGCS